MFVRRLATAVFCGLVVGALGCDSGGAPGGQAGSTSPAAPKPAAPPAPPGGPTLDQGIVLALAQFVTKDGKQVPGPARLEFLTQTDGEWSATALEDPDSNVFHKAMLYDRGQGPELLSLAGTAAHVKTWTKQGGAMTATSHWSRDFGGKWSRMRDAEVADLYADGAASIAVATHDQGVVAVMRPQPDGSFEIVEIDQEPDTFVHEIEIGDLDADGVLEVYATPSEPNRLDGTPQHGEVVRYVPKTGEGRVVVADLGDRHAKEILVADVDGDGTDELYVAVEAKLGGSDGKQIVEPVEIRRYEAGTAADAGVVVATLNDRLTRFLTAGDVDGDGRLELVAASFSSGLWLLRPGDDANAGWSATLVDADSAGFEHASILTDLDGDGVDELYVASDRHKEVRRYVWDGTGLARETIYVRPDNRPIFTWNLMPIPLALVPSN